MSEVANRRMRTWDKGVARTAKSLLTYFEVPLLRPDYPGEGAFWRRYSDESLADMAALAEKQYLRSIREVHPDKGGSAEQAAVCTLNIAQLRIVFKKKGSTLPRMPVERPRLTIKPNSLGLRHCRICGREFMALKWNNWTCPEVNCKRVHRNKINRVFNRKYYRATKALKVAA